VRKPDKASKGPAKRASAPAGRHPEPLPEFASRGFDGLEAFSLRRPSLSLAEQARRVIERSNWNASKQERLSRECRALLDRLRDGCPGVAADLPIAPGEPAGLLTLKAEELGLLLVSAAGAKEAPETVWSDGTSELLVHTSKITLAATDGLILVTIPVECQETGNQDIGVVFATGSAENPAGLIFATGDIPEGPAEIVEIWGEQLLALAWTSLLRALTALAAQAGADLDGTGLIPSAMAAGRGVINLQIMARHEMDRVAK
jgi:hypothetical protein